MFNCFRYSWINSSLDGSEDDQFSGYENIEKINKIIKIKNDELYYNSPIRLNIKYLIVSIKIYWINN